MARPRTVGVSVTPEARDALNDLVVQVITASQGRVTQSDALRVAARVMARAVATDAHLIKADLEAITKGDTSNA
jgi:hypothetical protein